MANDASLDITGAGKLAKAIPPEAWNQLVDTACTTFRQAIAPVTSVTSGVGRLLDAKFDRLVDAEKVLAAETFTKASARARASGTGEKRNSPPSSKVLVAVLEKSSVETDLLMRELWASMLAGEFSGGKVHPEFPMILARMNSDDAQILAKVANESTSNDVAFHRTVNKLLQVISMVGVHLQFSQPVTFAHEHLRALGLIVRDEGAWALTHTGRAFFEAVAGTETGDDA